MQRMRDHFARPVAWVLGLLVGLMLTSPPAHAQNVGEPDGTRSVNTSKVLPAPDLPFGGKIEPNVKNSKEWWPPRIVPAKGAPNVLLIMTDDVGFGAPSTFGGIIPTPNLDRIAKMGLRYTQFHSTALCSPTRAALITGRNHHSVGFGVISETATGFPGYNSVISKDKATIGELLKQNGYGTSWFGKDHNTPEFQSSQAGPFDQWPIGMGFEYFYGFVGGDTSQWQPNLVRNTTPIHPYLGKPGWNLTTAMAEDAIAWMRNLNEIDPSKPFFCYYVPGGTHAPHHPTPEWIAKFKGKFSMGWDKLREQIFANQKRLGVIPPNAKLTAWPDKLLKHWDALTPDEKKLFERQVEVYAAYLAYTDHEIGRVIDEVAREGKLDNTLIVYISGDNGSSAEGSPIGTPNEVAQFNGITPPVDAQLKYFYDVWGSDKTYNHMAVGWTWAFDTPFKWTKQVASHFGGTRQGMCIAWPARIKDAGGIRTQFHHMIDVVPTILEAARITEPEVVNGVKQKPIEGISMMYTFDKTAANTPSRRHTQYFEMFGNRGLYHDGWYACTVPVNPPWNLAGKIASLDDMKWELYDLKNDPTQFNDVAAANPGKLKEMQGLFLAEAAKYQVFPLDNSLTARMVNQKPSLVAGRSTFTYTAETSIPRGDAPSFIARSYTVTADIDIPQGGAEGMLLTNGGRFCGYGFYLLKSKPVFLINLVDLKRLRWEGADALTPGHHLVTFDFKYDGGGLGKGGNGVLSVDGKQVASQHVDVTIPITTQWDESFDIGVDTGTTVADTDYQSPFRFTGKLNKVTVQMQPTTALNKKDQQKLQQGASRNHHASE